MLLTKPLLAPRYTGLVSVSDRAAGNPRQLPCRLDMGRAYHMKFLLYLPERVRCCDRRISRRLSDPRSGSNMRLWQKITMSIPRTVVLHSMLRCVCYDLSVPLGSFAPADNRGVAEIMSGFSKMIAISHCTYFMGYYSICEILIMTPKNLAQKPDNCWLFN